MARRLWASITEEVTHYILPISFLYHSWSSKRQIGRFKEKIGFTSSIRMAGQDRFTVFHRICQVNFTTMWIKICLINFFWQVEICWMFWKIMKNIIFSTPRWHCFEILVVNLFFLMTPWWSHDETMWFRSFKAQKNLSFTIWTEFIRPINYRYHKDYVI